MIAWLCRMLWALSERTGVPLPGPVAPFVFEHATGLNNHERRRVE